MKPMEIIQLLLKAYYRYLTERYASCVFLLCRAKKTFWKYMADSKSSLPSGANLIKKYLIEQGWILVTPELKEKMLASLEISEPPGFVDHIRSNTEEYLRVLDIYLRSPDDTVDNKVLCEGQCVFDISEKGTDNGKVIDYGLTNSLMCHLVRTATYWYYTYLLDETNNTKNSKKKIKSSAIQVDKFVQEVKKNKKKTIKLYPGKSEMHFSKPIEKHQLYVMHSFMVWFEPRGTGHEVHIRNVNLDPFVAPSNNNSLAQSHTQKSKKKPLFHGAKCARGVVACFNLPLFENGTFKDTFLPKL
ncbi:hypothetical protein RFI_15521 [Reticulomyxa filosa]|uniref:Uncharacterized protein n=1 Tax=Reticulomyxa filosa TaxID=46433 RepID=X6N8P5_RETFI|nr:hypothetical protein RFI_15521 [Reticulomyxa filosa]|eukprot:ETO21682.1 hypothetical protein RFI_15521 [Reticulomyxa filosa]